MDYSESGDDMILFTITDRNKAGQLGFLPTFFDESDPDPAAKQIHRRYAHGGGWHRFEGFELKNDYKGFYLSYPDDPPMREIARGKLRDETIVLFEHSWVAIIQPNLDFEVARVD
jgi:hypothetical protein